MARKKPALIMIEGNVARVELTKSLWTVLDATDVSKIEGKRLWVSGRDEYTYAELRHEGKVMKLHRFLTDAPPGMDVDHVNGDRLDNRRANLRICTHQENLWNHRRMRRQHRSSEYRGVSWCQKANRWFVVVQVDGRLHQRRFKTELEAAQYYDQVVLSTRPLVNPSQLNFPQAA